VEVLDRRPGDGEAVEGRGAAADLVEDDERPFAGLPPAVIARAREVLKQLEETERKSPVHALIDDLPLFSAARRAEPAEADPVAALLDTISPDELSPKEALEALYRLKALRPRSGR
jgi:DNA mismatch repair protein MutS